MCESFLMGWMNLEPIIQNEGSQKDEYCILTHIYGIYKESTHDPTCRGSVTLHRHKEETFGASGRRE